MPPLTHPHTHTHTVPLSLISARYFQIGRVVDGPTDFYAKDRARGSGKATLADELLNDTSFRQYHKKKFNDIQKKKARDGDRGKKSNKGKGRAGKRR
jgi:hypothetical protein